MKRIRFFKLTTIMAILAVMSFGFTADTATHGPTAPAAAECEGVAEVAEIDANGDPTGRGITAPGVDPADLPDGRRFAWSLTTDCTVVNADGTSTHQLNASGTATGFCGRSVADDGNGTLGSMNVTDITWESVGTVLAVSASHDGHLSTGGAAAGVLEAEVQASGGEACTTPQGATRFDVVIAGEAT